MLEDIIADHGVRIRTRSVKIRCNNNDGDSVGVGSLVSLDGNVARNAVNVEGFQHQTYRIPYLGF